MITNPPTITISRNIFNDINTWLDNNGRKDLIVVNVYFTGRYYILNYNTTIEFEEVDIPVEDVRKINYEKTKEFQINEMKKLKLL